MDRETFRQRITRGLKRTVACCPVTCVLRTPIPVFVTYTNIVLNMTAGTNAYLALLMLQITAAKDHPAQFLLLNGIIENRKSVEMAYHDESSNDRREIGPTAKRRGNAYRSRKHRTYPIHLATVSALHDANLITAASISKDVRQPVVTSVSTNLNPHGPHLRIPSGAGQSLQSYHHHQQSCSSPRWSGTIQPSNCIRLYLTCCAFAIHASILHSSSTAPSLKPPANDIYNLLISALDFPAKHTRSFCQGMSNIHTTPSVR